MRIPGATRRTALIAMASGAVLAATGRARADAPTEQDPWPALAGQIFDNRPIADGASLLTIEAPYRAEDAAVVPVTLRTTLPGDDSRTVRAITLVIDANPSPLAAAFTLGADSRIDLIATRVRVNDYTNIHAVAELSDGKLYSATRYVKAAGGCSAPALTMTADAIPLGTMRFRLMPPLRSRSGAMHRREARLMIRHPNYSGMQMNQVTRLYIPAEFVQTVRIWQGDQLLLTAESGISISENPSFRFAYRPNGAKEFRVEAKDSSGRVFRDTFPVAASA